MTCLGLSPLLGTQQGSQATTWDRSQRMELQGGDENCRGKWPSTGSSRCLPCSLALSQPHVGPEPPSLVLGKDPDRVAGPSGG